MVDDESASNRGTFVLAPAPGDLLSWEIVLDNKDLYLRWGIPEGFFSHAVPRIIFVAGSTPWAGCSGGTRPAGTPCPDAMIEAGPDHTVGRTFGGGVSLHVFEWNGYWIARACGNFATDRGDVAKGSFHVIDAPPRIEADQPTLLTVRAVLTNAGPASPVEVEDVMVARGPADCSVSPERQVVRRRLARGDSQVVDFVVSVTCGDPSDHLFTFVDELRVVPSNVTDPHLGDNRRETTVSIPVFDKSDVRVDGVFTECDNKGNVDTVFGCSVSAHLSTAGPHSPALADAVVDLSVPEDCEATPTTPAAHPQVVLGAAVVTSTWDVVCATRSFHPVTGSATLALRHLHVEDPNSGNNSGADTPFVVEVFEEVDLRIERLELACERADLPGTYSCESTLGVFNAGPADAVKTHASVSLAGTAACSATPTTPATGAMTLAVDESGGLQTSWSVACPPATDAVLTVAATFRNADDEPHAVDSATAVDQVLIRGGEIDVKPRSLPSSVNPTKQGSVPVAILSAVDFDAFTEVDRATVRFGRTGIEDSLLRCAGGAEDVDDDGLGDLVCTFDAQSTGLRCGDTVAYLTARLADGTLFEAVGDVSVVPCRMA